MEMKKLSLPTIFLFFLLSMGIPYAGSLALAEPSLKAEPSSAELNPAALAAVKLMGSGFKPDDRILIVFDQADKGNDVVVAFSEADAAGSFEAKMDMLSILQGIMHFRFVGGKPTPDPNNPPLAPASYKLKASSKDSDLEATCDFAIEPPKKK